MSKERRSPHSPYVPSYPSQLLLGDVNLRGPRASVVLHVTVTATSFIRDDVIRRDQRHAAVSLRTTAMQKCTYESAR